MSILICTVGCSTPVGVKRVGTKEAHRLLTASALSTGTPSLHSLQVLSRLDLLEQFEDDPAATLAALHAILLSTSDPDRLNNRLFALAELSFLNAERHKQRPAQNLHCQATKGQPCPPQRDRRVEQQARAYYLAAAVYAYAFLFPEDPQSAPLDPADPRLRLAYDLYNRGLTEGLSAAGDEVVVLASGRRRLPFGVLDIQFVSAGFSWAGYQLEHFVPTANLAVRGLRNRYRRPGIGAPLAASLAEAATTPTPSVTGANRIPPRLKVPVTAFLRIEAPRRSLAMEPETRELFRQSLFVTPLPFVKRVVFISTPHRGSYQAALRLGRLASWLVTLPGDLSQRALTTITQNQDKLLTQQLKKLPTSVDNMNPSHPFIKTLASIPVAEGITAHSIIPVLGEGPPSGGNDGIVAYDSAHIDGVASELVVRFGHSVQGHPKAIEEVRRILTDHLNDSEGSRSGDENAPG